MEIPHLHVCCECDLDIECLDPNCEVDNEEEYICTECIEDDELMEDYNDDLGDYEDD